MLQTSQGWLQPSSGDSSTSTWVIDDAPLKETGVGGVTQLTQNDLWCAVVPRGHDGAVVLVVEGGTAEVHHAHGRVLHRPLVPFLGERSMWWKPARGHGGGPHAASTHLLRVVGHGEVRIHKQDVLRLQVRVCQFVVM